MQGLGNPDTVAAAPVPVISGRGEIAEVNESDGFLLRVLEIGTENHRHLQVKPVERVSGNARNGIHIALCIHLNHSAFVHKSIAEATVPGKHQRATHDCLHIVQFHHSCTEIHRDGNHVAIFPFPGQ